jgi:zinc protease
LIATGLFNTMMTVKNTSKAIKTIAAYARIYGVKGLLALVFPLHALAAIPIQQWTLPNGAQVFLVQSDGIPMVDVQIDFDAGSRRDPAAKAGLASVTASMTSKGVLAQRGDAAKGDKPAPALDENALSEAWADLGASFTANAGTDRMSFSLRTLTYPDLLPRATELAARQLGSPAFPDVEWTRERQRMSAALQEANRRPATVANRAFAKVVYGTHPYGQEMTEATLGKITVADMQALYRQAIAPCRATLSMVGAVNREQAQTLAMGLLAHLPATANCAALPPMPAVPEVQALSAPSESRIPFESAQAHVFIGQPGYKRDDPDFFALTLGNYILGGGGFVSRLTGEVREKRGLSYSVYSYFAPGLHAGAFTIGLQTRPDQAVLAVQVSREVLARFVADGPTEQEIRAAKDNLIGGFALRIDSNRKLLDNVANIAWNHLPLTYLDTWTQAVEKLTAADVKAAFARKLQPEKMATVIVGGAL